MTTSKEIARDAVGEYQWGFHDDEKPLFMAEKGLSEELIRGMSGMKGRARVDAGVPPRRVPAVPRDPQPEVGR